MLKVTIEGHSRRRIMPRLAHLLVEQFKNLAV